MEIVGFTLKHDSRPVFDKIAINLKAPNHKGFILKWGPSKNGIIVIHEYEGSEQWRNYRPSITLGKLSRST